MWPNPQFSADLVTFTVDIFNEKLQFSFSDIEEFLEFYKTICKFLE